MSNIIKQCYFILMSTLVERVSKNIKYYRGIMQFSQERLAEGAGLSAGMIGKIEAKLTSPSLKTIEKIAKTLGIDPYLLTIDPDSRTSYDSSQIDSIVSDFKIFLKHKYQDKTD